MYVEQFFVDGLGCASYLIGCEAKGIAAVVDPERDVRRYLESAARRNVQITHIIETHLHADHVSGNTDLAERTGADIYIHEASGALFKHKPLKDGDVLELGETRLVIRSTPGHTPESVTLFVSDTTRADEPWMALTGDLLFVGDAGRPDLVGPEAARSLAGELYESLYGKMLQQDDGLLIYPGHGAGSLCGRAIGSARSTTLGFERRHNPALAFGDKDAFVEYMTSHLPEQPGNHTFIKATNRQGPTPLGEILPRRLSVRASIPYFQRGAALLDTRTKSAYVKQHVPGSVHLEGDEQLSNRIGFLLPPDVSIVLLLEDEASYREVVLSLTRVGYEKVVGYLFEGIEGWAAAGLPIASGDVQDIAPVELHQTLLKANDQGPVVVDVREPWEYRSGHVPGAVLIPLGELAQRVSELDPSRPVAVICAHGHRSLVGAGLLAQKGFAKVYNVLGGTTGWQEAGLETTRN